MVRPSGASVVSAEQRFEQGLRLSDAGDIEGAVRAFTDVVRHRPDIAQAHFNLARALMQLGREGPALEHLERVVALEPGHLKANLGLVHLLQRRGDRAGALARLQQAQALAPGDPWIAGDLASALATAGRDDEAAAMFARALTLGPQLAPIQFNHANFVWRRQGDAAAVPFYERTVALDPNHARAWANLGVVHKRPRPRQAEACFRRALEIDARYWFALMGLLTIHQRYLDFDARDAAQARLQALLQAPEGLQGLDWRLASAMLYNALFTPLPQPLVRRLQTHVAEALQREACAPAAPMPQSPDSMAPNPKPQRLRIGYLSPNFGDHPVGHVTLSLFAAHDRQRFEVHGFSTRPGGADGSAYARLHRQRFEHFREIGDMDAALAAALIRTLGIHILVDLDGFMDNSSLTILARRPAPLQMFWLGHAGALGLPFVDYLIADDLVMPPDEAGAPHEATIRLPGSYHCADRHPIAADVPPRAAWGLPEKGVVEGVVYCVFNNPDKIDRAVFGAWMRILAAVDGSVLWFSSFRQDRQELRRRLDALACGHGIAPQRLILADFVADKAMHLARLAHADLMLDTCTLNASTTALDALWAGVPLLALQGDRFGNRISDSMLRAIGMADMVCADLAEYAQRAIALGLDAQARQALRQRLAHQREAMPLFDVQHLARQLEAGFELAWQRHIKGLAPVDIDVASV